MTSPYLERHLRPLAVALPQMLAQIETDLATAAGPAEEQWLRQRAELIRWLLAPWQNSWLDRRFESLFLHRRVSLTGALLIRRRKRPGFAGV